ncbi:hypothetical protein VTN77DRAFT_2096 [Rasamsonia byssochlamydoides]|uniref:uncharacterized protein n=1 Tax=Rasamsonia byssochlamydoides TaxID=89139 RepID=UPI0037446BA3
MHAYVGGAVSALHLFSWMCPNRQLGLDKLSPTHRRFYSSGKITVSGIIQSPGGGQGLGAAAKVCDEIITAIDGSKEEINLLTIIPRYNPANDSFSRVELNLRQICLDLLLL